MHHTRSRFSSPSQFSITQRVIIASLVCVAIAVFAFLFLSNVFSESSKPGAPVINKDQDLFVEVKSNAAVFKTHKSAVHRQQQQQQRHDSGDSDGKHEHPQHHSDDHKTQSHDKEAVTAHEAKTYENNHNNNNNDKDDDAADDAQFGAFRNNNRESIRAVLVRAVLSKETDPVLIELNAPYHALRKRIRSRGPAAAHRVHIFFTMDCTDHSAWQTGTLENSWERVGQDGVLTRIISGCEAFLKDPKTQLREKVERTKRHFLSSDEVARERRGSFYAPFSSTLPSGRHYAPYNRPHSVYYWLKHADLTEEVFVMLDPDMVFLNVLPTESVRLGAPVSQVYEYMEHTAFEDMKCPSCPNEKWDRKPYAVGPPWMMHLSDWIRVTPRWMAITGELAERYPTNWIVEMIAYSIACKVENLPHATTLRAMVDNIDDAVVWNEQTDELGVDAGAAQVAVKNNNGGALPPVGVNKHNNKLIYPSTLHYCYTFEIGEMPPPEDTKYNQHQRFSEEDARLSHPVFGWYHFSKYRVPTDWPGGRASYGKNFMDCETPLLQEFKSLGIALREVFGDNPDPMSSGQQLHDKKPVSSRYRSLWRRTATMLDLLLPAINHAMTVYKERYCPADKRNLKKLLRTTHPSFFISRWELGAADEKGLNVSYSKVVVP